jgi:Ca2+-binding RTX toxin-like protein
MPGKGKGKAFGKFKGIEVINGTDDADVIEGGNGKQLITGQLGDDSLFGGNGKDKLFGGDGNDDLWGGNGADMLSGDDGDDSLEGGLGDDMMDGGAGNDQIYSISWGGEPEIAQEVEEGVEKVEPNEPLSDDDVLTGGEGGDTYTFRWLLDAKEDILDKHRDEDGDVDYQAVAGENDNVHDHWVEGIGDDIVTDYNPEEDSLVFEGHTVALESATLVDADGDGEVDDTLLVFYSEQGGAGAHQGDALGTVTLLDAVVNAEDVIINANVFYGVETPFDAAG